MNILLHNRMKCIFTSVLAVLSTLFLFHWNYHIVVINRGDGPSTREHFQCPEIPPNLVGNLSWLDLALSYDELERIYGPSVEPGGRSRPVNCTSRHRVAIVVPFRNREDQLPIFLNHMHRFLQRQQLDYTIYVIEQSKQSEFNRGLLMNIGFTEARKLGDYDCFIFHDVDYLPENDEYLYRCSDMPRHMSVAVDRYKYRLPYPAWIGGVIALKPVHFELINGFSNVFFGWGSEDNDLFLRIGFGCLKVLRASRAMARYHMLKHPMEKPGKHRHELQIEGINRYTIDGLNSLQYRLEHLEQKKLFTHILVTVDQATVMEQLEENKNNLINRINGIY